MYREAQIAYIISDEKNPSNHPMYAVDTNFRVCILHIEESQEASMQIKKSVNQVEGEQGSQVGKCSLMGHVQERRKSRGGVDISKTGKQKSVF